MALALGFAAFAATLLGGGFALRYQDKLHLILGFSAGAVLGVALFDLLPESLDLAHKRYAAPTVTLFVAAGFFTFMFLNRVLLLHPEDEEHAGHAHRRRGTLGAASLSIHSFLDGVGIGLAFKVSTPVGAVVAAAVLAHDFSDGINTVTVILRNRGKGIRALRWLLLDAAAPVLGVASTYLFTLSDAHLGIVLSVFCGFFLYLGASDLLPESHHRHPKVLTGVTNILGATAIWLAIHFAGG
ncbi:MAG TPA: ZIP family metal transporter [Gaiellaceae bacterium]|nr:ZIP family metal transporter [Gaiellaceae bacterium]